MFNKLHVMLDLETLSTASNAAILAIGAVLVNDLSQKFYEKIKFEERVPGFDVSFETLDWWSKQDPAIKEETFSGTESLPEVLTKFRHWFPADACIWSNGASFDIPILGYAYRYFGMTLPWFYRNEMCFRTVRKMYDLQYNTTKKHTALGDAEAQGLALQEFMVVHPEFNW